MRFLQSCPHVATGHCFTALGSLAVIPKLPRLASLFPRQLTARTVPSPWARGHQSATGNCFSCCSSRRLRCRWALNHGRIYTVKSRHSCTLEHSSAASTPEKRYRQTCCLRKAGSARVMTIPTSALLTPAPSRARVTARAMLCRHRAEASSHPPSPARPLRPADGAGLRTMLTS